MTGKYKSIWPLPGGEENYIESLKKILFFIDNESPDSHRIEEWFDEVFTAKKSSMNYIWTLKTLNLIKTDGKTHLLTKNSKKYLQTFDDYFLFGLLKEKIIGINYLLFLLKEEDQTYNLDSLLQSVNEKYIQINWKATHQIRFRLNWLISIGLVEKTGISYSLTALGLKYALEIEEKDLDILSNSINEIDIKIDEVDEDYTLVDSQISENNHSYFEDLIRQTGKLLGYKSDKVNVKVLVKDIPDLKNKKLDGLWIKDDPFGPKIVIPFEVQISGSIDSLITRLETVIDFSTKAVIVTNERQKRAISGLLEAKKSKLLDKVVFFDFQDIAKIHDSAKILRPFFEAILKR